MKIAIAVLVVAALVGMWAIKSRAGSNLSVKLEDRVQFLAECGFRLAEPFAVEDLLGSLSREEYEVAEWDAVLFGLGMEEEMPPWRPRCETLWHFDTECIADHGDYKRIAERMALLAQGSLPIANIEDYVDIENGEAWLSFSIGGRQMKLVAQVEDDWVDPDMLSAFVALLQEEDPGKVFVHYDLGGQSCILGCTDRARFQALLNANIAFTELR